MSLFWHAGDVLSAEKLNQHLQKSNVFIIKAEYESANFYLNKTAEQLFQLLDQGYILYCEGYGFLIEAYYDSVQDSYTFIFSTQYGEVSYDFVTFITNSQEENAKPHLRANMV